MGIVYQTDKRSGITYAYESHAYWDKEKKQSRAHRTLIGRVDKETGEIVPTDGRGRKRRKNDSELIKKKQVPVQKVTRRFYGATYLLDAIGKQLGITEDLKTCFPETYQQILSLAYYLILEERRALSRFERWSILHNPSSLVKLQKSWFNKGLQFSSGDYKFSEGYKNCDGYGA